MKADYFLRHSLVFSYLIYVFVILAAPKIAITSYSDKQSWILGDDVMLTCRATGNPSPEVRWLKQRDEDGLYVPYQSIPDHNGTHIVIKDLKEEDLAVYRCEAVNSMGVASEDFVIGEFFSPYFFSENAKK